MIRVGAYTDTEYHAKKYKFENAVNATQAALQEGILPGGGSALLSLAEKIKEPMFRRAVMAPFEQMVGNAGLNGTTLLDTFMMPSPHEDLTTMNRTRYSVERGYGIDFKNKEIVPMFEAGIIDPFKVTRLALESATAIASSLVGMETAIITLDDEPKSR